MDAFCVVTAFASLREINEGLANLNDCARLRKWNRILMIAVTVLFVISAGAIY